MPTLKHWPLAKTSGPLARRQLAAKALCIVTEPQCDASTTSGAAEYPMANFVEFGESLGPWSGLSGSELHLTRLFGQPAVLRVITGTVYDDEICPSQGGSSPDTRLPVQVRCDETNSGAEMFQTPSTRDIDVAEPRSTPSESTDASWNQDKVASIYGPLTTLPIELAEAHREARSVALVEARGEAHREARSMAQVRPQIWLCWAFSSTGSWENDSLKLSTGGLASISVQEFVDCPSQRFQTRRSPLSR